MRRPRYAQAGFTLLEVAVSLGVGAIVLLFAAMLATAPVDAYVDQSGRSALSDSAELVMQRLDADLARALPNSVSISNSGTRSIIEMLIVDEVVFFMREGQLDGAARELTFSGADSSFAAFGRLLPKSPTNDYELDNRMIVVGNLGRGFANLNAYQPNVPGGVAAIRRLTIERNASSQEELVTLNQPFRFADPKDAPLDPANPRAVRNRMFLVRYPVTYICNSAANARTLRRYENYAINASMPSSEASSQLHSGNVVESVLATDVSACFMRCAPGNAQENVCTDALSVQIELNRATARGENEQLRVHRQYDMDNDL